MKIAIIGYGKMGQLIERIAKERGHKISCKIDAENLSDFESDAFRNSDVAIEFTTPATAVDGILACFAANIPVVSGTTGWTDNLPSVREMCEKGKGTLLYSSNFSIGMNIFRAVNRYLAGIMEGIDNYQPKLHEIHHIHKLDHPSGTAITLAEEIIDRVKRLKYWVEYELNDNKVKKGDLPVYHERIGEVPGTHTVSWESDCDMISITHEAKSREGFASGAVTASEWILGKKGFFTIGDMLSDVTATKGLFS